PLHYQAQGQWYMRLTGLRHCAFFVLIGGQRFVTYEMARDDNAIAALVLYGKEFLGYLRQGKLPAADGSDDAHATIRYLYPEHEEGKTKRADAATWALVKALRERRQQRETVKRQDAELQQQIEAYMGPAETLISPHDEEVARWSSYQSRRVDTAALREA